MKLLTIIHVYLTRHKSRYLSNHSVLSLEEFWHESGESGCREMQHTAVHEETQEGLVRHQTVHTLSKLLPLMSVTVITAVS